MKTPRLKAPPGGCDCHIHVYEKRYKTMPGAAPAPEAPVAAYLDVQRRLGLSRVVVVQPNAYGFDNTATLDAVAAIGGGARGIAAVDVGVGDAELERLTRGGMRGIRFQLLPGGALTWEKLDALSARVQDVGWHTQVQLDGRTFPEREAALRRVPGTMVIDHTGKFLEPVAPESDAFRVLLRLVERGNTYVKLAAPYETSKSGPPRYEDVGALAKALVKAAPERLIWASNWPHPSAQGAPPDDADLLDLLLDWAPQEAVRHKILTENPARLYGF